MIHTEYFVFSLHLPLVFKTGRKKKKNQKKPALPTVIIEEFLQETRSSTMTPLSWLKSQNLLFPFHFEEKKNKQQNKPPSKNPHPEQIEPVCGRQHRFSK